MRMNESYSTPAVLHTCILPHPSDTQALHHCLHLETSPKRDKQPVMKNYCLSLNTLLKTISSNSIQFPHLLNFHSLYRLLIYIGSHFVDRKTHFKTNFSDTVTQLHSL